MKEPMQPRSAQIMMLLGGIIVASVMLYYGFWAIDTLGLENQQDMATVTGKEYVESGMTYNRQYIGGQMRTLTQTTGAMYILELDVAGEPTAVAVDKALYDSLTAGDQIPIVFQRWRLTGALQVVDVETQ